MLYLPHRYWLTVERQVPSNEKEVPVPSQVMNTLSRYLDHPTVQFVTAAAADATAATVEVLCRNIVQMLHY